MSEPPQSVAELRERIERYLNSGNLGSATAEAMANDAEDDEQRGDDRSADCPLVMGIM